MQNRTVPLTVIVAFVFLQIATWVALRPQTALWNNVPAPPASNALQAMPGLGDTEFSHRYHAMFLQNFGSIGPHQKALKDYNYDHITKWLFMLDHLAPHSQVPAFLASYYFSYTQNHRQLPGIIDYLEHVGTRPGAENWRWLAQGIYLSRFIVGDQSRALDLANTLAALNEPDMPLWTKQMPAFILNGQGSDEEALSIMLNIIKDSADILQPAELYFTIEYVCTRILDETQRGAYEFCAEF